MSPVDMFSRQAGLLALVTSNFNHIDLRTPAKRPTQVQWSNRRPGLRTPASVDLPKQFVDPLRATE